MSDKILTFSHKFKDSSVCTVICDLNEETPKFTCPNKPKSYENYPEYDIWVRQIIMPEILNKASANQLKKIIMMIKSKEFSIKKS